MHAEHRGRTGKCALDKINHRVTYNYSKIVPIRIAIDRNNRLTECPIEFEVLQEVPSAPGAKDERITLGLVRLNLSEYVEESENFPRRPAGVSRLGATLENARDKAQAASQAPSHRRLSSNSSASTGGTSLSPTSTNFPAQQSQQHPEETDLVDEDAEEGIVRRYLMQDSKINSTLKISILMMQIDGERNYAAPALKTAPMFSGITGIMAGDQTATELNDDAAGGLRSSNGITSLSKSRDVSEVQDMYRRTLAASWSCQPGELLADECIEDIFSGGDGWRRSHESSSSISRLHARGGSQAADDDESMNSQSNSNSGSPSTDDPARGTLKPSELPRTKQHARQGSNHSDRSTKSGRTVMNGSREQRDARNRPPPSPPFFQSHHNQIPRNNNLQHLRPPSSRGKDDNLCRGGSSQSSSDRGRERFGGFRRQKEVDEHEIREDMVAWTLPGATAVV